MTRKTIVVLFMIMISDVLNAQAPQKMSFQAVIRNASNAVVSRSNVGIRISVLQGTSTGTIVYAETQNTTTNFNGLISLQIGTGTIVSGNFSLIDWANGPYFIKTETDPNGGTDYAIVGSSELLSVPYALFALNTNSTNSVDDNLGSSTDKIDLATLQLNKEITVTINKSLSFGTIGNIIITNTEANHFEGSFISYNKTTGQLVLRTTEVIGNGSFSYWTVAINSARGYSGLNGTIGVNGLTGSDGAVGATGATGANGIDGSIGGEPLINIGHSTQYYRGDKTWQTLNALTVGLGNIDNTADLNKSTYSATKLTTPRNINGISFDGSHDITISSASIDATNLVKGVILLGGDLNGIGSSTLTPTISLNAITNEKIADNAITTSKILDENITESKITNLAVTDSKILSISGSKITGNITGKAANITGILAIANGGTGAINAAGAKVAIGLSNVDNTSDLDKPISTATTAFVLANSDTYNAITAGNEIFTTSTSDVLATGLSFTPPAGKYIVNFNSQYTIEAGDRTGQAQLDLTDAYANLMARTVTNSTHGVGYGAGETLSPGVYRTAGAVTTTGTLTLDAGGNSNAEFIFQFGAAMSTGAGFKIVLTNGASACNVYWIAEGAIAIGASTEMKGMLISNSGAVSLGSMSDVQGNLFSSGGAIGIDASTISRINGCANNFGSINNFAIFSKTGNVSNAGVSTISGDIASNSGTVTGFGTATLNGNIYTSGISIATANFSVYQNGILIPYSTRKRTSALNIGEITLQALATIGNGENVEIRWNIDLGKVKMQNRIFTIQHVR